MAKKEIIENQENQNQETVPQQNEETPVENGKKTKVRLHFQSPIRKEVVEVQPEPEETAEPKEKKPKVKIKDRVKKVGTVVGLTVGAALVGYGGYLMGKDGSDASEDGDCKSDENGETVTAEDIEELMKTLDDTEVTTF